MRITGDGIRNSHGLLLRLAGSHFRADVLRHRRAVRSLLQWHEWCLLGHKSIFASRGILRSIGRLGRLGGFCGLPLSVRLRERGLIRLFALGERFAVILCRLRHRRAML